MKMNFDGRPVDLTPVGKGYTAVIDEITCAVEILRAEAGQFTLRVSAPGADSSVLAWVTADGPTYWVTVNGQTWQLTKSSGAGRRGGPAHHAAGELLAPMPGQVRAVQVAEGEAVVKGQTLVVVEAMKMEIKVAAPCDGRVKALRVQTGQTVEREQILVEIE